MTIPLIEAEPIDTCPREQGVTYVLLHRDRYLVLAQWDRETGAVPCWSSMFRGHTYGFAFADHEIIGWYPIKGPLPLH